MKTPSFCKKIPQNLKIILIFFFIVMFFGLKGTSAPLRTADDVQDFYTRNLGFIGAPIEFSRARTQYMQMIAYYRSGTIELTEQEAFLTRPDAGYLNRKFHSAGLPGISIFMYPFFLLGTFVGLEGLLSFIPLFLLHGFNIILFYLIARRLSFSDSISSMGTLFFGFGSLALVYASTPLYHTFSITWLLLLTLWTIKLHDDSQKGHHYLGYSMILMSLGIFVDYPFPLVLLPFFIYQVFFLRVRDVKNQTNFCLPTLARFAIFPIGAIIGIFMFHHALFGNIWQTTNMQVQYNRKEVTSYSEETIKKGTQRKNSFTDILEARYVNNNLKKVLYQAEDGLFKTSPLLLLGVLALFLRRKQIFSKKVFIPLLASSLISFLLYVSFSGVDGGRSVGFRYFIPQIPVLILLGLFLLKDWINKGYFKWAFLIALFWTYVSHFSGLFTTIFSEKESPEHMYGIMQFGYLLSETTSSFWYREVFDYIPLIIYPFFFALIASLLTWYVLRKEKRENL